MKHGETEYAFLEHIYKDVKKPLIELQWNADKPLRTIGDTGKYEPEIYPTLMLSCDDEKSLDTLKKTMEGRIVTETITLQRRLNDNWEL